MSDPTVRLSTAFKKMHRSGLFIIPNPFDAGTAKYLTKLGFRALATTSAGASFALGRPDVPDALSVDQVLANVQQIVDATPLPVSADFQNGYAAEPDAMADNVTRCVGTGVAGLSIEDASGDDSAPLYDDALATERVSAARHAIDQIDGDVVLTARCEAWLVNDPTPFETALPRLVAYADAGADCLFAPGVFDTDQIATIVREVHPKAVNVIMSKVVPGLDARRLEDLGVRRISVGSALNRVAWGAFIRAAEHIADSGSFDALDDAATFAELNAYFDE